MNQKEKKNGSEWINIYVRREFVSITGNVRSFLLGESLSMHAIHLLLFLFLEREWKERSGREENKGMYVNR